jgi:predicted dinucleotide-binding enzyme
MKVTIVGAGKTGRGIGTRAVAGGHDVEVADRDPEPARALAEELGGSATAVGPDDPFGARSSSSPSITRASRTP